MSRIIKNAKLDAMLNRADGIRGDEIIPYIDKYIEEHPHTGSYTVDDVKKEPDKYFHPSSDTLRCKRELFFRLSDSFIVEEEVISPELRRTFKIGHAVHAMVQAWFSHMGTLEGYPYMVGEEVPVRDDSMMVSGSVDVLMRFPSGVVKAIEIKTINSREFAKISAPKPLHKLQLLVYLLLLGYKSGIVLYIEKDYPHNMKEFAIEFQPPNDILRRWARVRECVIANDCSSLEFECKEGDRTWGRCSARHICRRVL